MIFAGVRAYVRFWIIAHCPYQNKRILKTPHLMQRSLIYLLRKSSSNPLCLKFCCHGNEGGKHHYRYLLHRPSYSEFCPKIRCHGNGCWQRKNFNEPSDSSGPKIGGGVGASSVQFSFKGAELSPILSQISLPWQRWWQEKIKVTPSDSPWLKIGG